MNLEHQLKMTASTAIPGGGRSYRLQTSTNLDGGISPVSATRVCRGRTLFPNLHSGHGLRHGAVLFPLVAGVYLLASLGLERARASLYFNKIDVSGGSAIETKEEPAKRGGGGGLVDIRTGVELPEWSEVGDIPADSMVLGSGAYHFRQVPTYHGATAIMLYISGDVTIYCRYRFAPARILRTPGYQGPVSVTVYAGTPLEFDDSGQAENRFYHDVGEVLLNGLDSQQGTMEPDVPAGNGGRFVFWTSDTGGIQDDVVISNRPRGQYTILASGGKGADGGDGGNGGEVTLLAKDGGAQVGVRANGGDGGDNDCSLSPVEAAYSYQGWKGGGGGGDGGSVAIRARTIPYTLFGGWQQLAVMVNGGKGGRGRPCPDTPYQYGRNGADGGAGGDGGHAGTCALELEQLVLDPASMKVQLDGGAGGRGGGGNESSWRSGSGVGANLGPFFTLLNPKLGFCVGDADTPPGNGGNGGEGGAGGHPGRSYGVLPGSNTATGGNGGIGGNGGVGGTAVNKSRSDFPGGTGGKGGDGGNSGSPNALAGFGGLGGLGGPDYCDGVRGKNGDKGQDGNAIGGTTPVALRAPPTGNEPFISVQILDAKPMYHGLFVQLPTPQLPFALSDPQMRMAVLMSTHRPWNFAGGGSTLVGPELPERVGMAADGTTRLLLVCDSSAPGSINVRQLMPPDTTGSSSLPVVNLSWTDDLTRPALFIPTWALEESPGLYGQRRHAAYAVIMAPDFIPSKEVEEDVTIEVVFTSAGGMQITNHTTLKVVQPPALLVHGIWAGPETFTVKQPKLKAHLDRKGLVTRVVDYKSSNVASFSANQGVVGKHIKLLWSDYTQRDLAVTKVNIVAHSMGGILTRYHGMRPDYLNSDNFGEGDVRRLITIDTPHFGARTATFSKELLTCPGLSQYSVSGVVALFAKSEGTPVGPALFDLVPDSEALRRMTATPFPGSAITGVAEPTDYYGLDESLKSLRKLQSVVSKAPHLLDATCIEEIEKSGGFQITQGTIVDFINSIFREPNDRIVELTSQLGGLGSATGPPYLAVNHSKVVNDGRVAEDVWNRLTLPSNLLPGVFPAVGAFSPVGHLLQPDENDHLWHPQAELARAVDPLPPSVDFSEPSEDAAIPSGSSINIRFASERPNEVAGYLVLGGEGESVATLAVTSATGPAVLPAPTNLLGDYTLQAFPLLTNGHFLPPVVRTVRITSTAIPVALNTEQALLHFEELDREASLDVWARFNDGTVKRVHSVSAGTTYKLNNPGVVVVDGDGRVTSIGPGATMLTVEFGPHFLEIPVVVKPAPPLVADVSATTLPEGWIEVVVDGLRLGGVSELRLLQDGRPVAGVTVEGLAVDVGREQATARVHLPVDVQGPLAVQLVGPGGVSSIFVTESGRLPTAPSAAPQIEWEMVSNGLRLRWSARGDWRLQQTAVIGPEAVWEDFPLVPEISGDKQNVVTGLDERQRFYRLVK